MERSQQLLGRAQACRITNRTFLAVLVDAQFVIKADVVLGSHGQCHRRWFALDDFIVHFGHDLVQGCLGLFRRMAC